MGQTTPILSRPIHVLLYLQILDACITEFNFDVPSSELNELNTVSDVVKYYSLPRQPLTGEQVLLNTKDLPSNVHLQFEPVRFADDNTTISNLQTAFPQRDTVVTSLKYRRKYKGYTNTKEYQEKEGYRYQE